MNSKLLPSSSSSFIFFFLLLITTAYTQQPTQPTPSPSPTSDPSSFILSSCNTTLYQTLCYTSLSRYATYIHHNPFQLTRVAIGLSLVRARHTLASISNMTATSASLIDKRASSALQDCHSLFGDTVEQMHDSLKQMSQLVGPGGSSVQAVRFQLSNVQTWMSAALTNEDTCTDGFQDVGDCPVKDEVFVKVGNVKEFTSKRRYPNFYQVTSSPIIS